MRSLTILSILAAFLLLLPENTTAQESTDPIHTIQIGTFMQTDLSQFASLQDIGYLYTNALGNNLFQVFMGGYRSTADAERALSAVRTRGFLDAFVTRLPTDRGQEVAVIQLSLKTAGRLIEWENYTKAGPLYTILDNNYVKIVTGVYGNEAAAVAQLPQMKKMGYHDAFVKMINSALLHEVSLPSATPSPASSSVAFKSGTENVPTSYDAPQGAIDPGMYRAAAETTTVSKPEIRGNVKRSSVLELQRLLQDNGTYKSGLDGLYGNGTQTAFVNTKNNNQQIQKYRMLADNLQETSISGDQHPLQYAVDHLLSEPALAGQQLSASSEPIAKAYRAYMTFLSRGPGQEVNSLMNTAIRETFAAPGARRLPRFDHTASYAYNDLSQLVLHLHFLHAGASGSPAVPCWLLQRYPEEAQTAYNSGVTLNSNYRTELCGSGFMEWEEIKVLVSMAQDMNAGKTPAEASLTAAQSMQSRYYNSPAALADAEKQQAQAWATRLMDSLRSWSARDPLLAEIGASFKMMYYQSAVLLEDYYMNKGMNYTEASALATATLQALVGPYLERFV